VRRLKPSSSFLQCSRYRFHNLVISLSNANAVLNDRSTREEKLWSSICAGRKRGKTSRILREFVIDRTLSFGHIRMMVVMRACVRSMDNEQLRETRLVIITGGRFAIRLSPLRVLCAQRIAHLALKLGVTRNFSDEDWRTRRVHRSAPDVFALWNRIEDPVPTAARIKDRHVQHQHRVVPTASPLKPFPWLCEIGLFQVCRFHLCVCFQW
jgi:hypothetical protein